MSRLNDNLSNADKLSQVVSVMVLQAVHKVDLVGQ